MSRTVSEDIAREFDRLCATVRETTSGLSWQNSARTHMPPWPGPGELVFIFMMLVFVLVGEKLPRIADALGKSLRGPK